MKTDNQCKPAISVVIPVYNSEEYIRRGIESLLYQTLENIEIICVNKGSTDSSLEILKEYQAQFPDKLFVYDIPYTDTPSEGRRFGVEKARGEYIYHCDADDLVSLNALERLYNKAIKDNCDMVLGYNEIVFSDGRRWPQGRVKGKDILTRSEAMLLNGAYWVRIIKKSLIERIGNVPEGMYCDDFAYIPVITSYAGKIGYVDGLIYYYYRKANSVMCTPKVEVVEGSIRAEKWILSHVNVDEIATAELVIGKHIAVNLRSRWQFADKTICWLREFLEQLSPNSLVYKETNLYRTLNNWYKGYTGNIPHVVYLNGLDENVDLEKVKKNIERVFYDSFEIVILDKSNCDINLNEKVYRCYQNGEKEFLGKYFALRKIYETGGIFLDNNVIIDNPLNYVTSLHAFFSYLDKRNLTDSIWGAEAGNSVIEKILRTYDESMNAEDTLADRIKNILSVDMDIELNGRTILFGHPMSLFSPDVMVVNTIFGEVVDDSRLQLSHLDFRKYVDSEEYCVVKKSTLDYITPVNESAFNKMQETNKQVVRYKGVEQREKQLQNELTHLRRIEQREKQLQRDKIQLQTEMKNKEEQLINLENSKSWKLTQPIRNIYWKVFGERR